MANCYETVAGFVRATLMKSEELRGVFDSNTNLMNSLCFRLASPHYRTHVAYLTRSANKISEKKALQYQVSCERTRGLSIELDFRNTTCSGSRLLQFTGLHARLPTSKQEWERTDDRLINFR